MKAAFMTARLTHPKTLDSFDFSFQPSLDKNRVLALAELGFIERAEVVHLLRPPGTGKSHLATALGFEDRLIYYEAGNPGASVAPDVFVVFGAEDRKRPTYKLWEEPKVPDFVLEVASPNTWKEDEGPKGLLYERLGVREYWQYDPTGENLPSRLKGRRLVEGAYEPQPVVQSLDGALILHSETLGLELRAKGEEMMRFRDPVTGEDLLSHFEQDAARRAAEFRAEQEATARRAEADARRAAEARVVALEVLLGEKRR